MIEVLLCMIFIGIGFIYDSLKTFTSDTNKAIFTIYSKLNKLIKMAESAEQTLDTVVSELGEVITLIEEMENDGSDLTAEEVRAKLQPIKERLANIANPPA